MNTFVFHLGFFYFLHAAWLSSLVLPSPHDTSSFIIPPCSQKATCPMIGRLRFIRIMHALTFFNAVPCIMYCKPAKLNHAPGSSLVLLISGGINFSRYYSCSLSLPYFLLFSSLWFPFCHSAC
ncbi:hypothetical protein BJ165DRAFT_1468768 [Panaeolus papilionaceus]|nr:hypothetical protein BJ165DRAFT_1468768 [Panaeolus papilionaceus]